MKSIRVKAYAKINLALAVKFKRTDGFHELESIFQQVEFADELTIRRAKGISFATNSDSIPSDDTNLCVLAGNKMVDRFNLDGLDIYLEKRIPVGAGLGGGSSDAAAVMTGAMDLYGLKMEPGLLNETAEQLGSDVPFFLQGGTAYVTGRGERLQSISMTTDYHVLLVFPPLSISTVWAYKNLNLALTKNVHSSKFTGFKFQDLPVSGFRKEFYNDFETLVFSVHPELKQIKQMIYDTGADFSGLSGSGSTVFGIYSNRKKIDKALVEIAKQYDCCITRPVSHGSR